MVVGRQLRKRRIAMAQVGYHRSEFMINSALISYACLDSFVFQFNQLNPESS